MKVNAFWTRTGRSLIAIKGRVRPGLNNRPQFVFETQ